MDVLAFQRKWIDASRQKERSAYVTHFNDLCELLGVDKPLDADPAGDIYGFEKGSKIAGGGDGWAAYGWPAEGLPGEVAEDVILSRLLALNGERAGQLQVRTRCASVRFFRATGTGTRSAERHFAVVSSTLLDIRNRCRHRG